MCQWTYHTCPPTALAEQKCYTRCFIHKLQDLSARKFIVRLFEINEYLCMFPPFQPNQQLPWDELLDIAKFAVLDPSHRIMRMHGFIPIIYDENVFVKFCKRCKFSEGPIEDSCFNSEVQCRTNWRHLNGNVLEQDSRQSLCNRSNDHNTMSTWCEYHQTNSHDTSKSPESSIP